jgi:hypothetical protein
MLSSLEVSENVKKDVTQDSSLQGRRYKVSTNGRAADADNVILEQSVVGARRSIQHEVKPFLKTSEQSLSSPSSLSKCCQGSLEDKGG